uniref:tyrosine-type recombinase/integrase n=1 Tax=Streptomyces sp. NRRL S-146 TaxID=1463884 RepID=UPI0004C6CB39
DPDAVPEWLTWGAVGMEGAAYKRLGGTYEPPVRCVLTERAGRTSARAINEAFVAARQDAGPDEELDLHCLRHSYITHLTEFGHPARFVQEQVGRTHAATTAIYMGFSDEYRNQLLEASLKRRLGDDWDLK